MEFNPDYYWNRFYLVAFGSSLKAAEYEPLKTVPTIYTIYLTKHDSHVHETNVGRYTINTDISLIPASENKV